MLEYGFARFLSCVIAAVWGETPVSPTLCVGCRRPALLTELPVSVCPWALWPLLTDVALAFGSFARSSLICTLLLG